MDQKEALQEQQRLEARQKHLRSEKRARKRKIHNIKCILLYFVIIVFILIFFFGIRNLFKHNKKQEPKNNTTVESSEKPKDSKTAKATICTAGDIVVHKPFLTSSNYHSADNNYNFKDIFKYVKNYLEPADLAVTTMECALTKDNYTGYPTFHAPDAVVDALSYDGTDTILLANNHIYDNGSEGLHRTMKVIKDKGIDYSGTRQNEKEKRYTINELNGIKVGYFNYVFETEKINNGKSINGIAIDEKDSSLINSFDEKDLTSFKEEISDILSEMKKEGVEYTIAYMHWGIEYQTQEAEHQRQMAQILCDLGVNALIGSHPHVIQPVDLLTSTDHKHQMICAYAIGNHLSNQRREYISNCPEGHTEDGLMISMDIERDKNGKVALTRADFIPTWVYFDNSSAPLYYILPLDHPEKLESLTGLSNIETSVHDSLNRTNTIIKNGVNKIQKALPLS